MPKKLRKTLGDVFAPSTVALRALIDTQSKDTIRKWCLNFATEKVLPIYEKHCPNDNRLRYALVAAMEVAEGTVKLAAVKSIIREAQTVAQGLDKNPVTQAAARAVSCGAAIVQTSTQSLGLYFYAAAAIAYDKVGLEATDDVYDEIAEEVCLEFTAALRAIAVEDEPNPAKLKWNC